MHKSFNGHFLCCSGVNLYAMLTGRLPYTVEPFNISTLYNKMLRRQMNAIPEYLSEGGCTCNKTTQGGFRFMDNNNIS